MIVIHVKEKAEGADREHKEDNANRRSDAEKASKGVDGKSVQLIRQASNTGQLYGSVSARDIAEALEGVGAPIAEKEKSI